MVQKTCQNTTKNATAKFAKHNRINNKGQIRPQFKMRPEIRKNRGMWCPVLAAARSPPSCLNPIGARK